MKNLENSALMQEMNVNEMQEVNGGWVALALAVAGAAIYVYNNWDDFCVGVKCVYEELSEQECKCFCGGDKAMRSLGNSVGSIGASICNFLEYFGQMAQNSPTAYG